MSAINGLHSLTLRPGPRHGCPVDSVKSYADLSVQQIPMLSVGMSMLVCVGWRPKALASCSHFA